MNRKAKLIIFSGLPGSGKSMLADYASEKLSISILAKDWVEATLWRSGVTAKMNSGSIAYGMLTALAEEQLKRGISIILDSVATSAGIRSTWQDLAKKNDAQVLVVECICSDEKVHRERLAVRKRNIEGWPELKWSDVLEVKNRYQPWKEKRLTLDSIDDFNENAVKLMTFLKENN